MGKNTTKGDKKIVLQDQLYEEILNGFEEVPGSVDAKKVILNTVYKKRLERVGEYFFANKETHHFVKTWAGNLSGTSVMDELLERLIRTKNVAEEELEEAELDADEEYLQNDYDEKREKNIFNVLGFLKWIRYIHIVRDLYNSYKRYKEIGNDVARVWEENISDIQGNTNFSSELKKSLYIWKIENLFIGMSFPVLHKAGVKLRTYIEKNRTLNSIFDALDEMVQDIKTRLLIKGGINLILAIISSVAPEAAGSKAYAVVKWGSFAESMYSLADTYVLLKKVYEEGIAGIVSNYFSNWNMQNALQLRQDIHDNMGETFLFEATSLRDEVEKLDKEVSERLDADNFIKGQINDFSNTLTRDYNTVNRISNVVKNKFTDMPKFNDNIKAPNIKFDYDYTFNNDEKITKFFIKMGDLEGTILDRIKRTHEIKYNFVLTDKSYNNLYNEKTGLVVLNVIKKWKENLIASGEYLYSVFSKSLDKTSNKNIEKINETIKKIDDLLSQAKFVKQQKIGDLKFYNFLSKEEKERHERIKKEEQAKKDLNDVNYNIVLKDKDGSYFQKGSDIASSIVQSSGQAQVKDDTSKGATDSNGVTKKLRLSEHTLQPIHPIITNGALTGIQLELLDDKDNNISIDIDDWFNPKNKDIKIFETDRQEDKELPSIKRYIHYMKEMDIIQQYSLSILDEEKKLNDLLLKLLSNIYTNTKCQLVEENNK